MLAKNVNDNACLLNERGACEFFASKLAPTKNPSLDSAQVFQRLGQGTFQAVRGHGGITARVIESGIIRLDDELRVEPLGPHGYASFHPG